MPAAYAESVTGGPTDAATVTSASITVAAGTLVSVWIGGLPDSGSFSDVTVQDDSARTFTANGGDFVVAASNRAKMYHYPNHPGGTITVSATKAGAVTVYGFSIHVEEVSGIATSSPVDLYNGQGQTGVSSGTDVVSSGSLGTPSADGGYVHAGTFCNTWPATIAAGTGYTISSWRQAPNSSFSEHLVQTTATGVTATFTQDEAGANYVTAATVYKAAASGPTTVTGSDTGSGTEGTPAIGVSGPRETGTGSDAGLCSGTVTPIRETGTGTEGIPAILLTGPRDTGTGTETAALVVVQTGSDTGTFTDNTTEIEISSGGESGTGSETGSVSASAGPGEAGTGTEAGVISATVTARETGTGTESATVVQTGTNPSDGDTGSGADAALVEALLASLDSGTGVDAASVVVTLVGAETGTGTDTGWLSSVEWTVSESGTGTEAAAVTGPTTYSGLALGKPYIVPRLGGEYP